MQIMRDDKLREYNIYVETDSTVFADENAEKQTRIEFLQTMGAYLEKAIAVSNANPSLTPIMFQSLRFLVGAWKVGREFEEVIDQTEQQIMQQMQQAMQAPPQPSEAEKIAQAKIQGELMREKMKQEGKLADIQAKSGAEMTKIQSEAELSRERNALKEDLALLNTDVKLAEKAME